MRSLIKFSRLIGVIGVNLRLKRLLWCFIFLSVTNVHAQIRNQQRPSTRRATSSAIDYSRFLHTTKKHQQACNTCHKIPTESWQKSSPFPDIVDYPDHDACVSCHRAQFFKGARPVICSGCHTRISPHDDARFAFRKTDVIRQFAIEFPHDRHQDVIAVLQKRNLSDALLSHHRVFPGMDDKSKTYNNCAICHAGSLVGPIETAPGFIDNFVPKAAQFKSSPADHAACFNCHWKAQRPINSDCGGCHKLTEKPLTRDSVPTRISMKFRHDREQHIAECTTCHINITKAASLRGLKPDVPITACTECHNKDGLRLDVSKELEALDKDQTFVCVYCHTSNVGRLDPPAGHYLIAGREPLKRKDVK